MDQAVLAEIKGYEAAGDFENPRYMELLMEHHYVHHVLRMPATEWPDPVNRAFKHINPSIYVPLQGPSELGLSGKLLDWDRTSDLGQIEVPTLVIGAQHDTMDPAHMKWMASAVQQRALPALSRRQPHGDVRRPEGVCRRPDRLHPRRGWARIRTQALYIGMLRRAGRLIAGSDPSLSQWPLIRLHPI